MSAADNASFRHLEQLIERELELAGRGNIGALEQAVRLTGEYMQTLPFPAPDGARASIERAKALRGRVTIETRRLQEQLELSRRSLRTARRMARTYSQARDVTYSTTA